MNYSVYRLKSRGITILILQIEMKSGVGYWNLVVSVSQLTNYI